MPSHLLLNGASVPPTYLAGLLLAALSVLRTIKLPAPKASKVISTLGVSRARAYEARQQVMDAITAVVRGPGRPAESPPDVPPSSSSEITSAIVDFVMAHPGCACRGEERSSYSEGFRHFVLELLARHPDVPLAAFSEASHVPLGTLKDWLAAGTHEVLHRPAAWNHLPASAPNPSARAWVETVLEAWRHWHGDFVRFCKHVRKHLLIDLGNSLISNILFQYGERQPKRRARRRAGADALRKQFETFFPGAQWTADGSSATAKVFATVGKQTFTFNVELVVDCESGAICGMSVHDTEDGRALLDAFDDAVRTTGAPPLALLVDNRPSNHSEEVDQALGDTIKIRATPGRAENKAHVEGAFGLFKQALPPLCVAAVSLHSIARDVVGLVATTWARTLNHKPRVDRDGSRVQLYDEAAPTEDDKAKARAALLERRRRQQQALQTQQARLDPVLRALLDDTFARFGLQDPNGYLRAEIATYPLDAIIAGIATFEGKARAGRLPSNADGRYLFGIVRNIAHKDEGAHIAEALWRHRQQISDAAFIRLNSLHQATIAEASDHLHLIQRLVDHAMHTVVFVERDFWLGACADAIRDLDRSDWREAFLHAARRIHATFRVSYTQRLAAVRRLAAMTLPLT